MANLIPTDQIERLAHLTGVQSLDDWKRELDQAEERIERLIGGEFEQAWERCFPIWLKQGRVRDLSRAMRTQVLAFVCLSARIGLHRPILGVVCEADR